jgi:hypothetical protein
MVYARTSALAGAHTRSFYRDRIWDFALVWALEYPWGDLGNRAGMSAGSR